MREALVTAQFDHEHVVMCIGVVTSGQPEMLVIQLCDKGALNDILKKAAAAKEPVGNEVRRPLYLYASHDMELTVRRLPHAGVQADRLIFACFAVVKRSNLSTVGT